MEENIKKLKVKKDSIDVAGIKKDYKDAIMEYIWNGFDVDATKVDLTYNVNELGGISEYSRNQVFAFQKYIDLFLK